MTIPQSELQELFPRFAAPLVNGEAATRFGETVAKQLALTIWQAMIEGPVAEARLWKSFGEPFTADDVAMLRCCFEKQMKASVSPDTIMAKRRPEKWTVPSDPRSLKAGRACSAITSQGPRAST